jgi:branched-chain amino acid transport system permease protein
MDITVLKSKRFLITGLIILIILIVLALIPPVAPDFWTVRMSTILMFVILAVSWTMFSGPTGYMSLAPAAFFGIGIYTAAFLGKELPLPAFIVLGGLVSFIVALLVGALTLRLRGIYFAIFTFGLVELINHLLGFWELHAMDTRGRFVVVIEYDTIFYAFLIIFVVLMITAYLIKRSKFGLALQSIGENEEAAAHIGINVTMVKVITFAVSAFFMGAAGAIWATKLYYVDPGIAFNPFMSFMPVLMAIFGGMGQLYGPIIGAVVFTLLKEYLTTTLAKYGIVELYMLIFGIVLVVAILYLPNGVVGLIERLVQKWRKGGSAEQSADT